MENLADIETLQTTMETSEGNEAAMEVTEVTVENAVVAENEMEEHNETPEMVMESTKDPENSEAAMEIESVEQDEDETLTITMMEEVPQQQEKLIKFRHRYFVCHPCGKCFHVEEFILHKQEVHGIDLGYKRTRSRRTPKPVKLFQVENTKGTRKSSPRKSLKFDGVPQPSGSKGKRRSKLLPKSESKNFNKCRFCRKKLPTAQERHNHEKMFHQLLLTKIASGMQYKCDYCSKIFASKQGRMKHKAKLHPEMIKRRTLVKQEPVVFKRTTYACKMCPGFKFKSRSSLEDHIKMGKHDMEVEEGKDLGWGFAIVVKTILKPEVKPSSSFSLERKNRLECNKCLRMFDSEVYLEQHKLLHTTAGSKQCRICQLQFPDSTKRRIHEVQLHLPNLSERELASLPQCAYCSKYFGAKFQLVRHKSLEHGDLEREREAEPGSQSSPRKVHDRKLMALGINRQCRICYKTFANSTARRSHELTLHFENLSKEEISMFPQCAVCHLRFGTEYKLNKHIKSKHSEETLNQNTVRSNQVELNSRYDVDVDANILSTKTFRGVDCPHCSKQVSGNWLNAHIFKHHRKHFNPEGITLYECMDCQEQFLYPSQLISHKLSHKEENQKGFFNSKKKFTAAKHRQRTAKSRQLSGPLKKNFKCKYCSKTFVNRMKLRQHEPVHTGEKRYFCLFCDEVFTADYTLKYHKIRQHYDLLSPGEQSKAVKCQDCGQHYGTVTLLKGHADVHHSRSGKYKCDLCPNRYQDERRLNYHIGRAHSVDSAATRKPSAPAETVYKSQKLAASPTLTKKKNKVTVIRKKKLQPCSTYKCRYCNRKFKTKKQRKTHENVHTGSIYKACRFCGSKLHGSSSLKYHLVRFHYDLLTEEEKIGVVCCSRCGLHFPTVSRLKIHEQIHSGEQLHSCDLCANQFKYRITLNKHMRKKHPEHTSESERTNSKQKPEAKKPTGLQLQASENEKADATDNSTESAVVTEKLTLILNKTASKPLDDKIEKTTPFQAPASSAIPVSMNSEPGSSSQCGVSKKLTTEDQRKSQLAKSSTSFRRPLPQLAILAADESAKASVSITPLKKKKNPSSSSGRSVLNDRMTPGQKQSITSASKFHLNQMKSQKPVVPARNISKQSLIESPTNQNMNHITITPLPKTPKTPATQLALIENKLRSLLSHNQNQAQCLLKPAGRSSRGKPKPPPAHSATTTEKNSSKSSCSTGREIMQQAQPPHYVPRKAIVPPLKTNLQPASTLENASGRAPQLTPKFTSAMPSSLLRQPQPTDDLHSLVAHLPSISLFEVPDDCDDSSDEVIVLEEKVRAKPDVTARPLKQEIQHSTAKELLQAPQFVPTPAAPLSVTLGQSLTITSIPTKSSGMSTQHLGHQQKQSGVIVKNPQPRASSNCSSASSATSRPQSSIGLPAQRHSSNLQLQHQPLQELSSTHLSVLMKSSNSVVPVTVPALSQATLLLPKQLAVASSTLANLTGLISGAALTAVSSKFSCTECSGSFGSAKDLKHHQRTAHNQRNVCRFCGEQFASHSAVQKHTFGAHRAEYIASGGDYNRCPLCGKEGRYKSCLSRHRCQGIMDKVAFEARKSSDEANFKCKYCSSVFKVADQLFLHLSTVHSEQYEKSVDAFMELIKTSTMNDSSLNK